MQNFPSLIAKILLVCIPMGFFLGILSGLHFPRNSAEASSARESVTAPAGTVLRVRVDRNLDTQSNLPGDRFQGLLDSRVAVGGKEVLPQGTAVTGHVVSASKGKTGKAELSLSLESYEHNGKTNPLWVSTVARISVRRASATGDAAVGESARVRLPANTIVGFTLKQAIANEIN